MSIRTAHAILIYLGIVFEIRVIYLEHQRAYRVFRSEEDQSLKLGLGQPWI